MLSSVIDGGSPEEAARHVIRVLGTGAAVIGAPGTGKTNLAAAVVEEFSAGHGANSTLVVTPNRPHADELRDRITVAGARTSPIARSIHSLAFAIVAAATAVAEGQAAHFVSGADQDAILATFFENYRTGAVRGPDWPATMDEEARDSVAFRSQLREALAEVMAGGFDFSQVEALALQQSRREWSVIAQIGREYEDFLALSGPAQIDTSTLFVHAAAVVQEEIGRGTRSGSRWSFSDELIPELIVVDAAQDIPDAAVPMLEALSELGARFVVMMCPESSTQGFRGATGAFVSRVLSGASPFAGEKLVLSPDSPAQRQSGRLAETVHQLIRSLRDPRLRFGHVRAGTGEQPAPDAMRDDTEVLTHTCPSPADRVRFLASAVTDLLHAGTDPGQIAAIARTSHSAAQLVYELRQHGVPVPGVARSLSTDLATSPILRALCTPAEDPNWGEIAREFLSGAFGEVDSLAMRALSREVDLVLARHAENPQESADPDSDPDVGEQTSPPAAGGSFTDRLTRMIAVCRQSDDGDEALAPRLAWVVKICRTALASQSLDPERAVWNVWAATGVAQSWQQKALRQPSGLHASYIDAVIRLQTLARKMADDGRNQASVFARTVIDQRFAQDSLAESTQSSTIAVGTPAQVAHREFDTVFLIDLEEGVWPNPRVRGSVFSVAELLEHLRRTPPEERTSGDFAAARKATVVDEAHLFISALSRAKRTAVLCAVEDGEVEPGTFFRAVEESPQSQPYPVLKTRQPALELSSTEELPATLTHLVGLVRREYERTSDRQWAQLLKALSARGIDWASPAEWNSWQEPSSTRSPVGEQDRVSISPSQVQDFADCPLKWFFKQQASGSDSTAQSMGNVIHSIAQGLTDAPLDEKFAAFDAAFESLEFPTEFERSQERDAGRAMVESLHLYLSAREPADIVGHEYAVQATSDEWELGGPWIIRGRVDRMEVRNGLAHIIDYKTSNRAVNRAEAEENLQLATYQTALNLDTGRVIDDSGQPVADVVGTDGAELVYVKKQRADGQPTTRDQSPQVPGSESFARVLGLVSGMAKTSRGIEIPVTPSAKACKYCPVSRTCPAQAVEGSDEW